MAADGRRQARDAGGVAPPRVQVALGGGTPPLAAVLARMPSVARSAPSEMTGKMPASRHFGSMFDQS